MNIDDSIETITSQPRTATKWSTQFSLENLAKANELSAGLLASSAFMSSKYLYDGLGSILFEAICVVPEYYPTRIEAALIEQFQEAISQAIAPGSTLIDLGAGNCAKAARLFPLIHPHHYVPLDISIAHLTSAVRLLQLRFPHINMNALEIDFSMPWNLPLEIRPEQRLFFYPGSSIGNFSPGAALRFLQRLRTMCDDDGGLLIGIDLIKDEAILNAAYNDSLGITSAFNLNCLHHANRILGADFNLDQWQHRAFFNQEKSRIEMHLEAKEDLDIQWQNHRRHFRRGETIHTENSYKYSLPSFLTMLGKAGFNTSAHWTDDNEWYALIYATAA